ncbi:MAG: hypothetical protein QXP36_05035 [Conexivisphaerales archaeon]
MEQLHGIAWLIIGIVFGLGITYATWRRQLKFPLYRLVLVFAFISMFVVDSFEGRGLGALFVWASSIIGLSVIIDILTYQGKELNEKLVAISMLVVIIVGGTLANVYMFQTPTSFTARIFTLAVFMLLVIPFVFALIAYLKGKKELSKKLTNITLDSIDEK